MSNETSKALRRRWKEEVETGFPWRAIFTGKGIDVGPGPDPLPFEGCTTFDQEQGDANDLAKYFASASFDYLHASQCLEHMHDPESTLRGWLSLVKPGGHVVATVPDLGLYENFTYPSRHNPDHKASFSLLYEGSPFPVHVYLPKFFPRFEDVAEVLIQRLVVRNFDWKLGRDVDQTWIESNGVEIWNEFVLKKK